MRNGCVLLRRKFVGVVAGEAGFDETSAAGGLLGQADDGVDFGRFLRGAAQNRVPFRVFHINIHRQF